MEPPWQRETNEIKTLFPLLKNDMFVFAAALKTDLNTMKQCSCRSRRHLMLWRVEGRALAKVWEALGQKGCPPTQNRACGCVKWASGSSDTPFLKGKEKGEDVSTPMKFAGSVSVHWPSSQPEDWWEEASQSCDFLPRSPCKCLGLGYEGDRERSLSKQKSQLYTQMWS